MSATTGNRNQCEQNGRIHVPEATEIRLTACSFRVAAGVKLAVASESIQTVCDRTSGSSGAGNSVPGTRTNRVSRRKAQTASRSAFLSRASWQPAGWMKLSASDPQGQNARHIKRNRTDGVATTTSDTGTGTVAQAEYEDRGRISWFPAPAGVVRVRIGASVRSARPGWSPRTSFSRKW